MRILTIFSFCVFFFMITTAHAKPVYKWEDESGIVHYSSAPTSKQAKRAKLPEISRGEVKLAKRKLVSCSKHGGIDCQAGQDSDGSVICYDGFRGASARYRFSCNSPKLEITQISDIENGTFSVFIRNSKSVAANKAAVFFKPLRGRQMKLKGPAEIEAFGLAEFVFNEPMFTDLPTSKVSMTQLNVTCANCPK